MGRREWSNADGWSRCTKRARTTSEGKESKRRVERGMQGRVRRRVNGTRRVVRGESNVYEAIQEQRNWEGAGLSSRKGRKTSGVESVGTIEVKRPHYCYKEGRRGVSATCRMCRVEREGGRKPVPSCARPVGSGMSVWTETPRVQKVREGVRERRLRNHPLDCPICDQGGECDLQEQTEEYGSESSRMRERKRGVEDKSSYSVEEGRIGRGDRVSVRDGQIKMVMTRCIHCTRCVRYGKQVGKRGRGMRGRGKEAEVGRYTGTGSRQTVMAGNRVDRCPVGARTAEGGKFKVRPWERKEVEMVDRRDSVGVSRKVKYAGTAYARGAPSVSSVKPERGERGERVGDKTRYGYDGRENGRRRERTSGARNRKKEVRKQGVGSPRSKRAKKRQRSLRRDRNLSSRKPEEVERRRRGSEREGVARAEEKEAMTAWNRESGVVGRWSNEATRKQEVEQSTKEESDRRKSDSSRARLVGTGVDRGRREERKRGERRGEWSREGLGVGKRAERRRHEGERSVTGRAGTNEGQEASVVKPAGAEKTKVLRTLGSDRGKERPVVGRKRGRGLGEAGVGAQEWQMGCGGGAEKKLGVGREKRKGRAGGESGERRERRSEAGSRLGGKHPRAGGNVGPSYGEESGSQRNGKVRMGGGRWRRSDGSGWLKRKGNRRKGRSEREVATGKGRGVSRRQHRSNTQGRRGLGLRKKD